MKLIYVACTLFLLLGTPAARAQTPWIVGGSSATQGQFPFVGNIMYEGDHYCGASLIYPRWAITAGHCAIDYTSGGPLDFTKAKVRFNSVNTVGALRTGGVEAGVKAMYPFPTFSLSQFEAGYDIALVELTAPVTGIAPISMAALQDTATLYATGNDVKIAGWGLMDTASFNTPNIMKWCATHVYDAALCNGMFTSAFNAPLSRDRFCAGYKSTQVQAGAAAGDSGGPVWREDAAGKTLIGIVSGGFGNTTLADLPGFFTKVAVYRRWIDSMVTVKSVNVPEVSWTEDQIRVGTSANSINLSFLGIRSRRIRVALYNTEGRCVHHADIDQPASHSYRINNEGMPAGLYILRITDPESGLTFTRKLANTGV